MGTISGRRNRAVIYVPTSGTGKKGQLGPTPRITRSQDTAPHWTWRLQVEKAAGLEIPEGAARTGGGLGESLRSWCLSGLRAGQGRQGESLQA